MKILVRKINPTPKQKEDRVQPYAVDLMLRDRMVRLGVIEEKDGTFLAPQGDGNKLQGSARDAASVVAEWQMGLKGARMVMSEHGYKEEASEANEAKLRT